MHQNTIYEDGNIISAFTCMKRLNALNDENKQLKKENKKLICIMKQLEAKYECKGFSLAYDMGECE